MEYMWKFIILLFFFIFYKIHYSQGKFLLYKINQLVNMNILLPPINWLHIQVLIDFVLKLKSRKTILYCISYDFF
jgi:hypothetical protein